MLAGRPSWLMLAGFAIKPIHMYFLIQCKVVVFHTGLTDSRYNDILMFGQGTSPQTALVELLNQLYPIAVVVQGRSQEHVYYCVHVRTPHSLLPQATAINVLITLS